MVDEEDQGVPAKVAAPFDVSARLLGRPSRSLVKLRFRGPFGSSRLSIAWKDAKATIVQTTVYQTISS